MIKKFSSKLPTILQTDTQKEFFSATFDQLFSPAEVEQAQGFIGRRSSEVFKVGEDNYLGEPTKLRAAYQLEPIAYAVNTALEDTNEMFYEDLLNYIEFRGGDTSNHDRLFADNFYSFSPPIDVDKYLNYQNYLWLADGGPTIFVQYVGSGGATEFDNIIESQIIGAAQFNTSENDDLRPRGLDLSSGMRIRFEGSSSYDRALFVEGVGREIRLVEELSLQQPGDTVTTILWDNSIIAEGAQGTGYAITMTGINSLVAPGRDYQAGDVVSVLSPGNDGVVTPATITIDTVTAGTELSTINGQTQANYDNTPPNGTFTAGSNYLVSDVITLDDGTEVTVVTVNGSGGIVDFTITSPSVTSFTTASTLTQVSTSRTGAGAPNPEGSGFTLTTDTNNETPINAIATYTLDTAGDYLHAPINPTGVVGSTILAQDETNFTGAGTNGTFAAGSGYVNAEQITLSDGTVVTVDTVDGGGAVLTFDITLESQSAKLKNDTLTQTGTTGVGVGFTLTLGDANERGSGASFDLTIEGELVTVSGGTFTTAGTLRPVEVTAAGIVEKVEIIDRGNYTVFPDAPASTTSAGAGTGLQVDLFENGDTGELWDASIIETGFDASVVTDISDPDYLTIERGSCEGSVWARTNRWFNVDIVNTAQTLGQIIDVTIVSGGLNYSVGDQLPVAGDGINGVVTVTAVDGVGTIIGVRVSSRGQGYSFGGIDQTGAQGTTDTVLWDATDATPTPSGESWDTSFLWDEVITSGGGQDAIIDITLASAIDRSTKALRPIIEFRRDLQLYEFGNKYLMEVQVVADNEIFEDVEGQAEGVEVDGVVLRDGMRMIFLDPTQIPNFFPWDESPDSGSPGASYWDTVAWEAEGASGAVSRFIWQIEVNASGTISLVKVDPYTQQVDPNAEPVPEGGVVLATLGDEFSGDSFFQYKDPISNTFTWRECQSRPGVNTAPLYELYDINGVQLADELEYPGSDFAGNEIFSYRILTAADIQETGGSLTNDSELGFPLTLDGLKQISDIVFENDLETNRVTYDDGEIAGYYFYREWDADPYCNLRTDGEDNPISEYKTNWLASVDEEEQRVIDRYLTETDTESEFELSTVPKVNNGRFDIRVNEGRRLNTDEFAYVESSNTVRIFEKPTDTGFQIADGTDSLYSFVGLADPAEVYLDGDYQERGVHYNVLSSVQLDEVTVSFGGSGYTVNDTITAAGGTTENPAQMRVVSVDGGGAITGIFISNRGVYAEAPSSPFFVSGGTGTGAVINGTFIDATANTFTLQFIDSTGAAQVVTAGRLVEVREQDRGAPGANSVVEVQYASDGTITDDDPGFWEIPNGLENNPNNEDILEASWSQFAPHMVSIIENQTVYLGTAFGSVNNYRDTLKDGSQGEFILQTQAPLLKTMLAASSNELDIIEALRFSSKEYARYKNKFVKEAKNLIDQGFTPFNDGDSIPIDQWVDECIRRIIRSQEFPTAFNDTYMLAYSTVYDEETYNFVSTVTEGTTLRNFNTISNFVDLTDKRNAMYVYVDETIQRLDVDYYISNFNPIEITWINTPTGIFTITVRLYENMAPSHIPATVQKLGLAPISQPRVETDNSYRTPLQVLVNHDGSRTPLYGDYRDDLLFEFETRIYNGILEQFRVDYIPPLEVNDYRPGHYRTTRWSETEWNRLLRPSFFKWVANAKADYITNEFYDANDPWTWNYSEVVDANGDTLPGYWRGIFDHYYDTQTPHITPWEMLGFKNKPTWWDSEYGTAPYFSSNAMWTDLENGTIRAGYRAGTDERYARPGLTANSIPVDVAGNLRSTPLLCIANDASLASPTSVQAAKSWQYGDLAPVEYAWRIGEEYSFAESEAIFLARPGEYGEKFWDPEHTFTVPVREQQIVSDDNEVYKRVGNDTLTVHGETIGGVKQVNTGWQVWVSSRLRALGKNLGNDFGQKVRTLNVKLGHKMASFTNKDTMTVFVEGISVASQANNLLIPQENITVSLHTSPPVREYVYGGVLIRAQADGTFQLFGYDILNGEFNYIPRKDTGPRNVNVNVGGQPERFTTWQANTTYERNRIVRFNTIYYRALETHSSATFDQTKWQKLSKLPITGGINVTYKPDGTGEVAQFQYGEQLDSAQEVFDLIIGYGDWLEQEGWAFENMNPETGQIETWLSAAKQFLLWTQSNWEPNSIVMISPSATGVTLDVNEGYPAAVEKITNGVYSILDKNGVVIDPRNTIIKRDGRRISVLPAIEQVGVYGARINTTDTESILTFDNTTIFNDTIYDPLLGTRLARLQFNGRRTTNWTGKLEAGGYIITENGLIPNFENMVDSIRFYHDTETILDNPDVENAARHLIGFSERDYYEDLQIIDDAQFQFYQGSIRQKGTVQSIRRLERSTKVGDATRDTEVFEEWALKLNEFGDICGNQTVEFFIRANEVKVDPQLVQLSYPSNSIANSNTEFFGSTAISGGAVLIRSHGYSTGDLVLFTLDGNDAIPELSSGTIYSIIVADENTINLAQVASPSTVITLTNPGGSSTYKLTNANLGTVTSIDIVSNTNQVYSTPPSVTLENHPDDTVGQGATATSVLDTDGTLLRIDVLDGGYGYTLPPTVYIGDTVIDATDDRAVANITYEITVDDASDDVILIDIDDNVRWPTKPTGIACNIGSELWSTVSEEAAYRLPNAGNVSILDTNYRFVSTAGLDALSTLASPPSRKGETIHVAYGENEDFAVYLLNNLGATTNNLVIEQQIVEENPIYSQGRVVLGTNLSSIGEDQPLEEATLTFSTNGSFEVDSVTVTNSGYGYWQEDFITISAASDSGLGGSDPAIIPISNDNGRLILNVPQQLRTGQNSDDFRNVGEEGTFTVGTGYANLDTITMSDGSVIQVDNTLGGEILAFTVSSITTIPFNSIGTLTQVSTSGAGSGFTLTLGGANVELATTLGSGYTGGLGPVAVAASDIPGATQSGRYLSNVPAASKGKLYVNNILYDYTYTGADTVTSVIPVGRGTGYAVDDELSANGGFTLTSPAVIKVDSIHTITGQTEADFSGVAPNGAFVGGSGYADTTITFDHTDINTDDNEIAFDTGTYPDGHGFTTGEAVVLRVGDAALPGGLTTDTIYYVIRIDDATIQLASTAANAIAGVAVDITTVGGTITSVLHSFSETIALEDTTLITVDVTGRLPIDLQTQANFTGAGGNGTFTAGRGYALSGDTITLEDGTFIDNITISGLEEVIVGQTHLDFQGGNFAGGLAHDIGDIITLSDGSQVEVLQTNPEDTPNNPVGEFRIISGTVTPFSGGATLTQSSTTGQGTGFSIDTTASVTSQDAGDITSFRVNIPAGVTNGIVAPGTPIQQESTSGSGTGFTLTLDTNNYVLESTGSVTSFTIYSSGTALSSSGAVLRQAQTTGNGVDFELTLDQNNEEILNVSLVTGGDYDVQPEVITSDHTSLAFSDTANTITTTGGTSLIDQGFGVGQRIVIENAEDAQNNGTYTIVSLTATVITVQENIPVVNPTDTTAVLRTETSSVVTVNGGSGSGATFSLEEFRPLYDITKDGTAVEDDTFAANTEFFVLSNIRYANTTNRDNFALDDIAAGIRVVWIDDNGSGSWEVQNVTAPILNAQTEADYDQGWTQGTGDHGTFAGGANFDAADTILLSNNALVTVDAVSTEGVVTEFTVTATKAQFTFTTTVGGVVDSVTITDGGQGYDNNGTFTITENSDVTFNPATGEAAVISYTVLNGVINSATVTSGGSGYDTSLNIPINEADIPAIIAVQHGDVLTQIDTNDTGIAFSLTVDSHNMDTRQIAYTQRAIQDVLVDTSKFKNAYVYEESTGDTIVQLPVYDPFKGIIPGIADLNISWAKSNDPARYNNSADPTLLSDTRLFDQKQVGLLWWDTSTCAYLYYEQGTDQYRRDNWGKLIDGSSIDVYEWTRSSQPPASYEGDGTVRSTTEYVTQREYDRTLEETRTFYYFWVKDRTVVPEGVERTLAGFEVARLLSNPTAQQYQWFAPISQTAFMFAGVEGSFTDSDNIIQINYRRDEEERPRHVEWQLAREGDPDYRILPIHWKKTVDSLCGFTDLIDIQSEANTDTIAQFNTDITGVDAGTEVITTLAAHGLSTGQGVRYSAEGGSETVGLTEGTMYYVNAITSTTLSLHTTRTDAIGDASRVDLTAAPLEIHTLTAETTDLHNFRNALPSASDPTKGYLVVPDPTLSDTERYGIETRPLQSMFVDIFGARRIFVDKVNSLMQYVNLRDENPTWNSSMTTNTLWEWQDWYAEGYTAEDTVPTFQVSLIADMDDIEQKLDGDIIRVTGTRWRLYEYNEDADTFTLVGREASRLVLLSDIYTNDQNLADAVELRELITALVDNVFVVDREINVNLIFFALLNYVFSEQEDLDWAFKTTYVFLKQQGRTLQQDRVFQNDPFDAALEFIGEFKPYQTKIRDFRTERATEIDLVPGTAEELVRDFNVDMRYDRLRGGDLSVAEMRIAKNEITQSSRWDGYTTKDSGATLVRLGAAGRYLASQDLSDIADIDSDILEAYSTVPSPATITFDVLPSGIVDNTSITIVSGGEGYYSGGTFVITTDSGAAGNNNAVILYTVDTVNGRGVINTAALIQAGSGYTPGAGYTVAATDMPVTTSVAITDEELEAVAVINEAITNEFAYDYEGLFLQNTEFTGNPSLISAEIANGGTGYVVGDILSLDAGSGTPLTNAQFRVATVAGGVITELQLINGGSYQQTPTIDPIDLLGGTGSGAQVTNLLFETGSTVPFDSTPHDQIGWDSSVFDPSVSPLEGTPLDLYRTIPGQSHVNFDGGTNEGTFTGGLGHAALDQIVMNDGTEVTVNTVNGSGTVTQFTIVGGSTSSNVSEATLTQSTTTGVGTDFTLTLGLANQSSANFFDVPPEETFNGTGVVREFTLTTTVPTVFLFVVVDGVEQRRNVDYFFIIDKLVFLTAPPAGTNNVQVYTYIEAGDLINPQVRAGVVEEMVPLDPRENLVLRADTSTQGAALTSAVSLTYNDLSPATITRGAGDFGADGIVAGQTIYVSGTASNDGYYDVASVAALTLTLADKHSLTTETVSSSILDTTTVSFTIHEDTQQGVTYYRNADNASVTATSNINAADSVIPISASAPLDPQPDWDNPALVWIGTELVSYHGIQTVYSIDTLDSIDAGGTGYTTGDVLTIIGNPSNLESNGTINVTSDTGGVIDGATLGLPGTYKENLTNPVSVLGGTIAAQDETSFDNVAPNGSFSGGTGFLIADIGQTITLDDGTVVTIDNVVGDAVTEFTISTTTTGVLSLDGNGTTITLDQDSTTGTGTGFRLVLHTNNQTGNNDATFNVTASEVGATLIGARRGFRGTHPQTFTSGQKIFSAQDAQIIGTPEIFWHNATSTSIYTGSAGQWRFAGVTENGLSSIHFSDTAASAFAANVAVGQALVVTDADVGFKYLITDLIAIGELGIVDVTIPGTGYEVGDIIDIDAAATGGTGVTAVVGGVDGVGGIRYVNITARGSGYTDIGTVTVPAGNITSTNGAGAELEVYFDTEGLVCALPDRILDVNGVIAEKNALTWQVDDVTYSLASASNTTAPSVFLRNAPGNAL